MKSFDFDFNDIPEEKSVSIIECIFSGLVWHCSGVEHIHLETEDEKGQKYVELRVKWKQS